MWERGILEVDVPILSQAANTDPNLEPMACQDPNGELRYLHTSPEFAMKRLLAAGSGDIYFLGKAFRGGESGRFHNPEFTLLEFYRIGLSYRDLMAEVANLVEIALEDRVLAIREISYRDAFRDALRINPHTATVAELAVAGGERGLSLDTLQRDQWLDLLMATTVCSRFPTNAITLIYDYPASQAALAEIDPRGGVALRFEAYVGALELANGYQELTDGQELTARLDSDKRCLLDQGQAPRPIDQRLIAAQCAGLPSCSGVAIGVDRLLMLATRAAHIDAVLAFPWARA